MATKTKFTVTVDREVAETLDKEARALKLSRSALVQEALKLFEKMRLEQSLKNGYRAMAEENLVFAEKMVHYGEEYE